MGTNSKEPAPKTVLLVPFSSKDPSRIRIWQHVDSWIKQTLDYPLYIGEHWPETPIAYNLSLARNHAAQLAGDWDVAVIHDADTVISPKQIQLGVKAAYLTGAVTYPYTERWELDFDGTNMLLADESSDWQSHMRQHTRNQPLGGCIIVRRDLWDLVRGFDSGFVGWGHEDGAFATACEILSGKRLQRIPGRSLHLEHVLAPAKRHDSPVYLANQARIKRYLKDRQRPDAVERIRKLRSQSIATDTAAGINWPAVDTVSSGMDQAAAMILLKDVTNVLDAYGCTHWLSDGTLLGAIRQNGFIAHDYDIDLGVWAADFDIRVIHDLVSKFSCQIRRLQGKPDDGMVITVGRAGLHLDLFFYYPYKGRISTNRHLQDTDLIYTSYYRLVKPEETSNQGVKFDFVLPTYTPLVKHELQKCKFWVPRNAKKHLAAAYGPKWKIDDPTWDTLKSHNIITRGIVKDMEADKQTVMQYLKIRPKTPSSE